MNLKKGDTITFDLEYLKTEKYLPSDFEDNDYWCMVIDRKDFGVVYFEGMIVDEENYYLSATFKRDKFEFNPILGDKAYILKILEIHPDVRALVIDVITDKDWQDAARKIN